VQHDASVLDDGSLVCVAVEQPGGQLAGLVLRWIAVRAGVADDAHRAHTASPSIRV
jgi:hypothetical protein